MVDFWKKFDDLMNSVPSYINKQIGKSNMYTSIEKTETYTTATGDKKVVIKTVNGKTTVTVNGKKYVEKK